MVEYYKGYSVLFVYLFLMEVLEIHLEDVDVICDFPDVFKESLDYYAVEW